MKGWSIALKVRWICGPCASTLLLLAGTTAPGLAQETGYGLSLDLAGGAVVPVGSASSTSSSGVGLALGLNHQLGERFSLLTEFQEAYVSGGGPGHISESAEIDLSRISLGIEALLTDPRASWSVRSRLSAGITRVLAGPFAGTADTRLGLAGIKTDAFTLVGGMQLLYGSSRMSPFVRIQAEVYFIGANLGHLQGIDETIGESGPLVAVPIQAGLRVGL